MNSVDISPRAGSHGDGWHRASCRPWSQVQGAWCKSTLITVSQLKSLFISAVISIDSPFDFYPSDHQSALKGLASGPADWSGSAAIVAFLRLKAAGDMSCFSKANKTRQDWKIGVLILLQNRGEKKEKKRCRAIKHSVSAQNGKTEYCISVAVGFHINII